MNINRPFGTRDSFASNPALKRRAILASASGTNESQNEPEK